MADHDTGPEPWSFLCLAKVYPPGTIGIDRSEWVLHDDQPVVLRSRTRDQRLDEVRDLELCGDGFASQDAAREACQRWVAVLRRVFAKCRIAVDFRDREPSAEWMPVDGDPVDRSFVPGEVLWESPGPLIFRTGSRPPIATPIHRPKPVSGEQLQHVLGDVQRVDGSDHLDRREAMAHDLFSMSEQAGPDAELVMLVSAVETLSDQVERDDDAAGVVRELIGHCQDQLEEHGLKGDPFYSQLALARRRSARQSARAVIDERLGALQYGPRWKSDERTGWWPEPFEQSAWELFDDCYQARSAIVHGPMDDAGRLPPSPDEIEELAVLLREMVGDLLASAPGQTHGERERGGAN